MSWFRRLGWVAALCAVCTVGSAWAASAADLRDAEQTYEAYLADQSRGYDAVNAAYRAALLAAPDDVGLAVARCEFIAYFTYAEDINWNDHADEDSTECAAELRGRWPDAPEVQVYLIENNYDDDALVVANGLWKLAVKWPKPLRARLASRLYYLHADADAQHQAGRYALAAARAGDASLLPQAITHLAAKRKPADAIALADAAAPATASWIAVQRIHALGKLADKSAALRELNRSEAADVAIPAAVKLRVYLDAGDLDKARKVAKDIAEDAEDKESRAAMFDLALAMGKPAQAAAWVSITQDELDVAMQRYANVLSTMPRLAFSVSLLPMTLMTLAILVVVALLPGVLLVPVHYRGLMRRVQRRAPTPMFERIGLRHAWIGTAVLFVVPPVIACLVRPDLVGSMFSDDDGREMFSEYSVMVTGTVAGLLLLSPWLRSLGWKHLFGERAHVARSLLMVMLCWMGVFAVSAGIVLVTQWLGIDDTSTAQTETIDALVRTSQASYGVLATILLMAVIVPLLEELIFRGLLLGGLSRHISFGWANTLQALLFAAIHVDPPRFLFYFALGLAAGWLVRRHHTLWPAVLLHALNNALAVYLHLA